MIKDFEKLEILLESKEFSEKVSKVGKLDVPFTERMRDSLGEAHQILKYLPIETLTGQRVLEVGAGLGIVSAYLEKKGVLIEAVEPAIDTFDDHQKLLPLVRQTLKAAFPVHACSVEDLPVGKNGPYDLIFSHNVLEHMRDPERSFLAMRQLLAPQGRMIHSCANYFFPYEPHLGIWIVPLFPSLTRIFSSKVKRNLTIWKTLNFITAKKIKRIARKIDCSVRFEKGLMREALQRLDTDPAFSSRQSGWPSRVYRWLKVSSLLEYVRFIPASFATPMVFYIEPN